MDTGSFRLGYRSGDAGFVLDMRYMGIRLLQLLLVNNFLLKDWLKLGISGLMSGCLRACRIGRLGGRGGQGALPRIYCLMEMAWLQK